MLMNSDLIGEFTTTVSELLKSDANGIEFEKLAEILTDWSLLDVECPFRIFQSPDDQLDRANKEHPPVANSVIYIGFILGKRSRLSQFDCSQRKRNTPSWTTFLGGESGRLSEAVVIYDMPFAPDAVSGVNVIISTSINVVIGVDLSNHALNNQLTKSRQVEMAQSCNEYGVAIQAVMEILQEYDSDQLFPAFGFGSKLSSGGKLAHKYPLSGEANNYFCKGMAGVLEAYRRSFEGVHLAGPICFSPIVRDVSDTARRNKNAENYYVLLILTNGTVDDWIETKKAVIETSFLPVSIIVIGIGAGKFSDMEILDQDFGLLKVGQEQACRDNVQFVQMRRFLRMAADGSDNIRWSKVALAKEVLAELPSQMLDYFERNHLSPCHQVPGQPENLKDLVDPGWWRVFTQPLTGDETTAANENVNQSSTASSSETRESQAYLSDSDKRSTGEASTPSSSSSTYPQETRPVRLSTNNLVNEDISSSLESPTIQGARGGGSSNFSREASMPWPSNMGARQNAHGKPSLQDRHIRRQMSLGPTQHSSTERMNIAGRRTPNMTEQDLGRSSGAIK
ncbi:unnamed protein product [Calicophoron daubneyi]|uniref:Copine C-terminal domain-containing protein n=1 Tax=Calicophoron daubneyi TaxID=300641 RepID=A0AAV2TPN1_CALDB